MYSIVSFSNLLLCFYLWVFPVFNSVLSQYNNIVIFNTYYLINNSIIYISSYSYIYRANMYLHVHYIIFISTQKLS